MLSKTITIPLYHGDLIIHQVKDLKEVSDKYGTQDLHGFEAASFRNDKKNGYSRYVLAFEETVDPMIIAHECLHFVGQLFADRYMVMDINNDEPQAYLLGWAVKQCHKYLKIKS